MRSFHNAVFMEMPEDFSLEEGYGCFQPAGDFTLKEITNRIDRAIAYCRENKIRALIANITRVTGFAPPTLTERFHFISHWAFTSSGTVTVCLIARPEMVLADKFGVVIAGNRGMKGDIFTDHDEAVRWIKTHLPRRPINIRSSDE
jgi:hypothetical protein